MQITRAKPGVKRGTRHQFPGRSGRSLADRFWEKVRKTDGCWVWLGARFRDGYGAIWDKPRVRAAHLISLKLAGVEIPEGLFADHICHNRQCIRPDHLRLVTPLQNAVENNDSPLAKNHRKTHCVHGHPLSGDNIVLRPIRGPKGTPMKTRDCLTCRRNRREAKKVHR